MSTTATKDDPKLWEKVKKKVTAGDKGGEAGQWSARKAQLAVAEYKKAGGGYKGKKSEDNHLHQWTEEKWGTRSGKESGKTGERYLPESKRKKLTADEYAATTKKKRTDSKKGKQFSSQPEKVREKVWGKDEPTKTELMKKAQKADVRGRSKMTKAELVKALAK